MGTWDEVEEAAGLVASRTEVEPRVALILGSGLGNLAQRVAGATVVPYADVPHFAESTAPGHAGCLVLGALAGVPVVVMSGRFHMYEGYSADQVVFPVRVMHRLGARSLIVTNAAGGVNTSYESGTLMLIADHINLTGRNPLIGPNEPRYGVRFPDMSTAYDPALRELARTAWQDVRERQGIALAEGVYLGLLGPSYETPAEIRMARTLGADAVGMSTVMEVVAANQLGMRILGISCITNMAAGILPQPLTEDEVIETAGRVSGVFAELILGTLSRLQGG